MKPPKPVQRLAVRKLIDDRAPDEERIRGMGPVASTRRDLLYPRSWQGLSEFDRALLVRFLGELGVEPDELHTGVPVGTRPVVDVDEDDEKMQATIAGLYPRRVDAALRFGSGWWLVECKRDAQHYVLGQVLAYTFWWQRDLTHLRLDRVIVVTDRADRDLVPILVGMGISVIEV